MIPDWFPNADTWAAWAQCVTAAIAFGAAIFAYQQVREARATRERVAQPEVVVYVDRHDVRGYFDVVIKNFGQTTAYNVRLTLPDLQIVPYNNQVDGQLVTTAYVPKTIAVLAPGQEWRSIWDSYVRRENYKGELQTQFVGHVEFDDKMNPDKASFRNPISLDANMFWNTMWIQRSSNKTVENALYEIAGTLKEYGQEHDGIWVYTGSGDVERQRREQAHAQMLQAHDRMLRQMGAIRDDPPETPGSDQPDD